MFSILFMMLMRTLGAIAVGHLVTDWPSDVTSTTTDATAHTSTITSAPNPIHGNRLANPGCHFGSVDACGLLSRLSLEKEAGRAFSTV
jgi:hypothetical protein